MSREKVISAFENQRDYCAANAAPVTAAICAGLISALDDSTATGRRVLNWAGKPLADALPLRLTGGLHHLYLAGEASELIHVYGGREMDPVFIAEKLRTVLARNDTLLLPWLDGPPQTNEAARSATYVTALHWLADRTGIARFEGLEIGSSAGLNLLLPYYHYDLGGVQSGPVNSPVSIVPEWRGDPPPAAEFDMASMRGCDLKPRDLMDDSVYDTLRAYIWPDQPQRVARMESARKIHADHPPENDRADAADWLEAQLAEPQQDGVCRVLLHSIVWQYLPDNSKAAITAMMETAGAQASRERPLAWISLEANRDNFRHELTLRHWPGDGEAHMLGAAHPHGSWMEWAG